MGPADDATGIQVSRYNEQGVNMEDLFHLVASFCGRVLRNFREYEWENRGIYDVWNVLDQVRFDNMKMDYVEVVGLLQELEGLLEYSWPGQEHS